jgi:hypothetical protein
LMTPVDDMRTPEKRWRRGSATGGACTSAEYGRDIQIQTWMTARVENDSVVQNSEVKLLRRNSLQSRRQVVTTRLLEAA